MYVFRDEINWLVWRYVRQGTRPHGSDASYFKTLDYGTTNRLAEKCQGLSGFPTRPEQLPRPLPPDRVCRFLRPIFVLIIDINFLFSWTRMKIDRCNRYADEVIANRSAARNRFWRKSMGLHVVRRRCYKAKYLTAAARQSMRFLQPIFVLVIDINFLFLWTRWVKIDRYNHYAGQVHTP